MRVGCREQFIKFETVNHQFKSGLGELFYYSFSLCIMQISFSVTLTQSVFLNPSFLPVLQLKDHPH
jgi:hypothetical protein